MHVHCQIHAAWPKPCCVSMSILHVCVHALCLWQYPCTYIEMPECRTVRHPVSPVPDWKKLTMPEQVRYRTKFTQSGIVLVRYRTKIGDAGMPMPALVSSMLMPSYAQAPHTVLNIYNMTPLNRRLNCRFCALTYFSKHFRVLWSS
jgi:hypothetical protein